MSCLLLTPRTMPDVVLIADDGASLIGLRMRGATCANSSPAHTIRRVGFAA
jgi:hypothetical protein